MIRISVPGTSANIGPGFDTLGLALNIYNYFRFEEISHGIEITGCNKEFSNENNLVYKSMLKVFDKIGYLPKGIKIDIDANIPVSRGLGSSAACILGGVMGANCLAGAHLSKEEILEIATEIEGHPDNIAPALFGGFVISIMEDSKVIYNKFDVYTGIKFVALIPDYTLSTKESRAVLPATISHKDAIYNISRVSLLLSSLSNGRFDLLKYAVKDSLHQPYRGRLISGFYDIINKCEEIGCLGLYLSGAGPTIMAIVDEKDNDFILKIKKHLKSINYTWKVKELRLDSYGTIIEEIN
ncbi:homoserine kinase [Tissierella praeacuta]|uniref:homoserine kinase n=1 Tax=Tissierella praeacuta TaxID=43131 RepID=UPI001043DA02|nr:homoserine kinase [Tissierella praeacuta]TCU75552.1 homoserine kinase [Tissierella praeacuta]